jgi:hypothetical protein
MAPQFILVPEVNLQVPNVVDVEHVLLLDLAIGVFEHSDVVLIVNVDLRVLVGSICSVKSTFKAIFEYIKVLLILLRVAIVNPQRR